MCDVGYLCAYFSLPIGISVLDLGPMYATDYTSDAHHRLMPALYGSGTRVAEPYVPVMPWHY